MVPGGNISASEFQLIAPGAFTMGGPGNAHQVALSRPFYLQKNEVTQSEWRSIVGGSPSFRAGCDQCPVEQVSWNDVRLFLQAINAGNPGLGYRLPTEAEWEYAARAGTLGSYGGSGVIDEMGWYNGNSQFPGGGTGPEDGRTWPVRQKLPNAWGLYDMHGNVFEWVSDWWSPTYYATSPATDPVGPASGTFHVTRGGSWLNYPQLATSFFRAGEIPDSERNKNIGFRLARTP